MELHAPPEAHARIDHHHRSWEWWLTIAAAIAAAAFGAAGLARYEVEQQGHADWSSVLYHTLQLFILHAPHLEGHVPWPLHVGRWLSAIVVLTTVFKGLMSVFGSEWRLAWIRLLTRIHQPTSHIVVCGLGRVGLQLAREFRRKKHRVVAIEFHDLTGRAAMARDLGVAVITGDAGSMETLQRACIERASKVFAVCDEEQTNVAIAMAIGRLLAGPCKRPDSLPPLECWMFIADSQVRETFQRANLSLVSGDRYRINVHGLNLFEVAARTALADGPLDFERIRAEDSTVVHLIIVGFGQVGQHLALQAARIGHYANFKKLKITVVEKAGSPRLTRFLTSHPKFSDICECSPVELSGGPSDAVQQIEGLLRPHPDSHELTTVALCWHSHSEPARGEDELLRNLERDDSLNLALAINLAAAAKNVLVFQTLKHGYGSLFQPDHRGASIPPHLHAFGMWEDTYSEKSLFDAPQDAIAKALHADYCKNQLREGRAYGSKPALYPWDQLGERFKASNRQAADHIPIKLRAVGYRMDQIRGDQPRLGSFPIDDPNIELLSRMEHSRWCAEKWLDEYSSGRTRDEDRKIHDCLVSWDQLTAGTQDWDRQQVKEIPHALEQGGLGIYPQGH